MNRHLLSLFAVFTLFLYSNTVSSQASCASPYNLGTIGTGSTCTNFASSGTTGSAPCAGSGYGGSGGVTYVKFCTGASLQCINFSILQGTASGNWAVTVYSANCTTVMDAQCLGNSGTGATFNTASPTTNTYAPNSCYIARIWSANVGSFSLCAQAMAPTNDFCTNPTQISTTPQFVNNFCMTAGTNGSYTEPTPAQFCAGSLENNAWYSFTTLSSCSFPCTVTITIAGINCSGGGAGFQIGFWTGACSTLTNIGCTSGSGGTVTATITNLNPNQTVIMGLDGNAGANCTYSVSATNTTPLPIELVMFYAEKYKDAVLLKWITATEKNNAYFVVERSLDAKKFEEVARVNGSINSNKSISYSTTDDKPYQGVSYYRLKQVDLDGTFDYSNIVTMNNVIGTDADFSIIPNPATDIAEVKFTCAGETEETVNIYDNSGRLALSKKVNCAVGENKVNLDLSSLSNGIYFVFFNTADKLYKTKLVKN